MVNVLARKPESSFRLEHLVLDISSMNARSDCRSAGRRAHEDRAGETAIARPHRAGAARLLRAAALAAALIATGTVSLLAAPSALATGESGHAPPAVVYVTANAVRLRAASGSVRTLARLTADAGPVRLAWSQNGAEVAWLIGFQRIGLARVAGGRVRTWTCECANIAFQRGALVSDSFTGKPHLVRYPASGSKPASIPVTGLPKSKFGLSVFDLLAATPQGELIAGYGTGTSAYGGPQLLYRISAVGHATLLAPKGHQQTANTVPWGFAFSLGGARMGFVLTGHGGYCANSDRVVLARTATGAETVPALPAGQWNAAAVWFSPSGTPYASLARPPMPCTPTSGNRVAAPVDFRADGKRWIRTGSGTISASYLATGWHATLTGRVISTGDGTTGYTGTRLTASRGSASFSIGGVTAFALQP
jgi:hypothetical protein